MNRAWNASFESAVTEDETHWIVELAVPWDRLDGKAFGPIGLHAGRNVVPVDRTQPEPLAYTLRGLQNHAPGAYAAVAFE